MTYDPDSGDDLDGDAQLDQGDTLDDRGVADPLDEGYSPAERPWAVDDFGTTAREEAEGEDLDHRLAREVPDIGDDDEGLGDTSDTDGELRDDQVGDRRSGRLVAADEGGVTDDDPDAWASDVGIDGAGASAEEAAVHVVEDED
ncbi:MULTISPECIES: DUF5709 domain-containing protein [unclassified Pseudonocardia]|jgi:hypothetical protein|uniref:DUF5709 domain-containing protein n=1 Tax=unclassified Pseudonocardia TaxID=2619320 RepID=UPI00095EA4F9|nr:MULTISPECIES: DUF5709 domain-containing protein [unclassified Pseudonocardia]MBN9097644.1 hypothetical protein [Pseudonocardia sp.]OJY39956.1 MAG: hypothetical protein BGP03_22070 [Pseudonocardia sp. 73-21]